MECDVCLIEWDCKVHIPRILSCGHTICEACLVSMFRKASTKGNEMFCPACMKKQIDIVEEDDIRRLIKNINLLRITEKIEHRRTLMGQSFINSRDNTFISDSRGNINNFSLINEKFYPQTANELICKNHGLQVHSYSNISNSYFCDLCSNETNIKAYPIPIYIREVKRKIDSAQIKASLVKQEIDRLEEFFISYLDEFESTNMTKIDDLFGYMNKLILYNYNTAKTVVLQCKKEQEIQIEGKLNQLKNMISELKDIEIKLNTISANAGNEIYLVKCNDELNQIFNKLNNYINYDTELNLFQMKIGLKENVKDSLFEFIQESYFVDVDFASVKDEPPLLKDILQKDKYWQCICGEMENSLSDNKCLNCEIFRKIESYDSIISNPLECSKEEICLLNSRRKQEIQEFQVMYRDKSTYENQQFYLIDIEWFLNWKCFVTNDSTDKYISNSKKRICSNKLIGILPPGPITNRNLFLKDCDEFTIKTLRLGLKMNDDFLIVNDKLWNFFLTNYNATIEINVENQIDIYSSYIICREVKYNYINNNYSKKGSTNSQMVQTPYEVNYIDDNNQYEKEVKQIEENEVHQRKQDLFNISHNDTPEQNYTSNEEVLEIKCSKSYEGTADNYQPEDDLDSHKIIVTNFTAQNNFKSDKHNKSKKGNSQPIVTNFSYEEEDPSNNTMMSDTLHINPLSNYDFNVKMEHFRLSQDELKKTPKIKVPEKLKLFLDQYDAQ